MSLKYLPILGTIALSTSFSANAITITCPSKDEIQLRELRDDPTSWGATATIPGWRRGNDIYFQSEPNNPSPRIKSLIRPAVVDFAGGASDLACYYDGYNFDRAASVFSNKQFGRHCTLNTDQISMDCP